MKLTVSPESFAEKFTGEIREQTFVQLLLKPLLFIINLLFYVIVVYILIPFSLDLPGNLAVQFVLFLVCLIVATYTTIFLYESACAVTGWLIGYRFALMQVGPIALVHTINGLRLRMIGNDPLVMAGMTWSSPLDRQKLHLRQMIFVNGGNLLLGILVITLQIFLNVVALETLSPLSKLTINLLVITIAYGLQHQILPLVHQLLRLFEHNSQEIVLHANHLTTCALNGTRPRDLDSAEIDHFLAIAQGTPAECQAAYIAYEHFYDQGNLEAAASTLDQAILTLHRTSEPELRTSLILAAAVYEAKHGAGPEQARRWLDLCALPHKSPVAVDLRLQYCTAAALISFRENRWDDAKTNALEALRLTEKTIDLGAIEPVREEVIPLLQKISDHTALPANPQQMQRGQQSALTVKRDSGPSIIHSTAGSLVHWASFAFIFFLLLKFNMVTATPSVLHQWLGDYHLRMEQPEQALTEYDIAIDILPNNTAAQLGRGYAYAAIGKAAYDKGEYTAAIAALDAALATPLVAEKPYLVYLYRGAAYAQLYNFDTALSDYQLAMSEMVSVDPRIYISIGSAHAGNGDYAAALFAYNQAIDELGETQLAPYYYRGIVYMALKEYEAAMADFNFLIAQNYDVPQIYFLRFLLQYRAGNVEAGDQDLRHVFASKDRPDMRTMGQLLGQLYTGAEAQVNTRWHSFNHPTTAPPAPVQNTPDPTRLPSLVAMAAQYGLVLAVAD